MATKKTVKTVSKKKAVIKAAAPKKAVPKEAVPVPADDDPDIRCIKLKDKKFYCHRWTSGRWIQVSGTGFASEAACLDAFGE